MVIEIWLLRTGLFLELLGGSLLAVDVLNEDWRNRLNLFVIKSVRAVLAFAITFLLLSVYIYSGVEKLFPSLLFITTDDVLHSLKKFSQFDVWIDFLQTPIKLLGLKFDMMYIFILLFTISISSIQYFVQLRRHSIDDPFKDTSGIWNSHNKLRFFIILLLISIVLSLPVVVSYLVGIAVFVLSVILIIAIPAIPFFVGLKWEEEEKVTSGLRFSGFLFLSLGFLAQIIWTFMSI